MTAQPPGTSDAEVQAIAPVRVRLLELARITIGHLPPVVGYFVADRLGDVAYWVARRSRRAAISNLRHVMGRVSRRELRHRVRWIFRNIARNYYDLARAIDMPDEDIDRVTDFDDVGWARMVELHRQGRSVILAGSHFGAFDMMTQVLSRRGLPISFLVIQFKPAWVSDFITRLRAARGLSLILVEVEKEAGGMLNLGALKQSVSRLRGGEVLGVVSDRNMEQQGATIPFFGYDTVVATGVAKMALRTRSAVVVGSCHRTPNNHYKVAFAEPIEAVGSAHNEEDVKNLLRSIFSHFERHIAGDPDQWVMLQFVWPRTGD